MSRVNLFVVLAILVVFSVIGFSSVQAETDGTYSETFDWLVPGGNPNQLGIYESLYLLGVPDHAWKEIDASKGHVVFVPPGTRLDKTTFGRGIVKKNVVVRFQDGMAYLWEVEIHGEKWEIFYFPKCSNWAIRVTALPQILNPPPTSVPVSKKHHHHWWWLLLLLIPLILWWLRCRDRQHHPYAKKVNRRKGEVIPSAVIEGKDRDADRFASSDPPIVVASGETKPSVSSVDQGKSNPGVAEAESTKPASDMTAKEAVAELRRLKDEFAARREEIAKVIVPAIEEARTKLAELTACKAEMKELMTELSALAYPPKPTPAKEKPGDC